MREAKEIGEDDYQRIEKEVDSIVAKTQDKIDEISRNKEKDVLTI